MWEWDFLGNVGLATTGSLSPGERTLWRLTLFGSARLGSPTHSRSRFALTHLPLSCHPTAPLRPPRIAPFYINPRFVPASSPLSAGKWEWTLVQRWIDPLCNLRLTPRSPSRFHGRSFLPFHPPLLLHPRYRRRRRRLLRTSPHPNPHLEDTSTLETPVSIGRSNARERHLKPPRGSRSLSRPPTIPEISRKARKIGSFYSLSSGYITIFLLYFLYQWRCLYEKLFLLLNRKNCKYHEVAKIKIKNLFCET